MGERRFEELGWECAPMTYCGRPRSKHLAGGRGLCSGRASVAMAGGQTGAL